MPTLTQLEYILAVAHHGHFGRAAIACHVSQPSLSMLIQKLEDDLGFAIFDRSKKPIRVTSQGEKVISQARVIINETKRLVDIGKLGIDAVSGDLRLGVIPTIAPYLIPLFIEKFAQKFPKVVLKIEELKTDTIIEDLENERIDAGLLATPLKVSSFEERVLFYEPFYLYASDEHPLYKRARVSESDLSPENVWLLDEGHCLRNQIISICSRRSDTSVFKNVHFESGNLETLKRLVDHSKGYTLLPHLAVMEYKDSTAKKRIKPFMKPVPTREVSLIYRRKQLKKTIIDGLFDTITSVVPKVLFDLQKHDIEIVDIG